MQSIFRGTIKKIERTKVVPPRGHNIPMDMSDERVVLEMGTIV